MYCSEQMFNAHRGGGYQIFATFRDWVHHIQNDADQTEYVDIPATATPSLETSHFWTPSSFSCQGRGLGDFDHKVGFGTWDLFLKTSNL